ncbi:hypothetical protein AMECASPLE_017699 [Ameca splendens]|uniref:Uncharacterized protein n=1 Tax=Ameca splendens TaxID=208324 RepID=A0ABV0YDL8_9TELE
MLSGFPVISSLSSLLRSSRRDARRRVARPALAATPSLSPSRSPSGTRAAVRDRLPVRASCISCTRSISNTKGLGAAGGQGLPQRRSEGRAAFSNKVKVCGLPWQWMQQKLTMMCF